MKKLKYLIKYGLKKRLFTKAFYISTAVIGLLIVAITLLPTIINVFTGEPTAEKVEDKITVVNTTGYLGFNDLIEDNVKSQLAILGYEDDTQFIFTSDVLEIPNNDYYTSEYDESARVYIYLDLEAGILVQIYDQGLNVTVKNLILGQIRELNRYKYFIDNNTSTDIISDVIYEEIINPNTSNSELQMIVSSLSTLIIIPIFIIITIGLQFIGTEIMEEKSTKAIEIIIASVPPRTHFFAKILSIMIFLIVQLLTYVLFGLIGYGLNELIAGSSSTNAGAWASIVGELGVIILPTLIITLFSAILGALIYSVIGAFFASMAVNQEDYQSIQTPIMMILMISYMGGIFAGSANIKEVLLFFTYFPFSAPLVLPVAYAAGYIGYLEVIISFLIMLATTSLLLMVFTPLYRASILSYDQSKLIKRIKNTYQTSKVLKENQKQYEENHN